MQLNWTIIGCGWLGCSLAEKLLEDGETVFGSTTTKEKLYDLELKGIVPFLVDSSACITAEIVELTNILVLSIPPFCRNSPNVYGDYLSSMVQQFNPKTKVLFLSSTGVYPKKVGVFNERYNFTKTEQATSLFYAEKQLAEIFGEQLTVLRLGGLIGKDRHPIHAIIGQKIKDPNGLINFVHQNDVIRAIRHIVEQNAFGETFNVVFPEHPKRNDYYSKKSQEFELPEPNFDGDNGIKRKISSKKIQYELGFQFLHVI